jgi:hypothetical protein
MTQKEAIQLVLDYGAKMRMNGMSNEIIGRNLEYIGCTKFSVVIVLKCLDDNNITADFHSKPVGLGWLSILAALTVTIGSCIALVLTLKSSSVIQIPFFVFVSCALGFAVHVLITIFLNRIGRKTSRTEPVPLPDQEVLRSEMATLPPDQFGEYFIPIDWEKSLSHPPAESSTNVDRHLHRIE